jgi:hypothetical protein
MVILQKRQAMGQARQDSAQSPIYFGSLEILEGSAPGQLIVALVQYMITRRRGMVL